MKLMVINSKGSDVFKKKVLPAGHVGCDFNKEENVTGHNKSSDFC